jgi:hypothetical protein
MQDGTIPTTTNNDVELFSEEKKRSEEMRRRDLGTIENKNKAQIPFHFISFFVAKKNSSKK